MSDPTSDLAEFLKQLQEVLGQPKSGRFDALAQIPRDLVYDDQDLNEVLYGETDVAFSPVSIFSGKSELFPNKDDDATPLDVVVKGVDLLNSGVPLSNWDLTRLCNYARRCLPIWPHPPEEPISPRVGELLDRLQKIAGERGDDDLRRDVCQVRWEYHEWRGEFDLARDALETVMQVHMRRNEETQYARALNNYAYQYQREGKWADAAREYERAASIFKRVRNDIDYTNSQQNYWECRFELDGLTSVEFMKPEVQRLVMATHKRKDWRQRKGFLILARIAEAESNLPEAIKFAQLAVAVDKAANTIYLDQDTAFLAALEKKLQSDPSRN